MGEKREKGRDRGLPGILAVCKLQSNIPHDRDIGASRRTASSDRILGSRGQARNVILKSYGGGQLGSAFKNEARKTDQWWKDGKWGRLSTAKLLVLNRWSHPTLALITGKVSQQSPAIERGLDNPG